MSDQVLHDRLVAQYELMVAWALRRYGQQVGQDYLHDAVILLYLTPRSSVLGLTDDQFIGLWRLYTTKAAIFAREHELHTIALMDSLPVQEKANYQYIKQLVGHLDLVGRRVVYRLFILGETLDEASASLGMTRSMIVRTRDTVIERLGVLIVQQNERGEL